MLTLETVTALPNTVLSLLHDATIDGDFDRVAELCDQIADQHPRLARELRSLAERFDTQQLLAILTIGEPS